MDFIPIGKIKKPHALAGAFHLVLTRQLKNYDKIPPHFYLLQQGIHAPFFVEEITFTKGDEAIMKLEDINSPEQARHWNAAELFLAEADVKKYFTKAEENYDFLIGYTAYDGPIPIGEITDIEELPGQVLATLTNQRKTILVPVNDQLITEINKRKRTIVFELPEGLLQL